MMTALDQTGRTATGVWQATSPVEHEIDPETRSWILERGLLTRRLAAAGSGFRLNLLHEGGVALSHDERAKLAASESVGFGREVELCSGGVRCVYAQTLVSRTTADSLDWLRELAEQSLGEALLARSGVERSAFEFALLALADPLLNKALADTGLEPGPHWARRSLFMLAGHRILVSEVFLATLSNGARL